MPIAPDVYRKIVMAKLYMDESFHESIDLDRISRQARQWLADKDLTVSEICNSVGFESIGSFSVLFKKEIGYAPQYYRNQAWLKKQKQKEQPKIAIPHCFIESYG